MKFKKGSLVDILSFTLIFLMFAAFIVAFVFNNSAQERRSLLVDFLNKEAMVLQAELEGYSTNPSYCFMFDNGRRLEPSEANRLKNKAVLESKNRIKEFFNKDRMKSHLSLDGEDAIIINILYNCSAKDVATVEIEVRYKIQYKTPYTESEDKSIDSGAISGMSMKDVATRAIENPIRAKNM